MSEVNHREPRFCQRKRDLGWCGTARFGGHPPFAGHSRHPTQPSNFVNGYSYNYPESYEPDPEPLSFWEALEEIFFLFFGPVAE